MPFHAVPDKLVEHYGFEICQEVIRKLTVEHAARMGEFFEEADVFPDKKGVSILIAESDGGMVPIVTMEGGPDVRDKRKTRKTSWKEAKLCFSRALDSVKGVFRATLGSPDQLGDKWLSSAVAAGLGASTEVHCLGDGAPWIKDQVDRVFGVNGEYLVDFYHLSEYLAAAAECCAPSDTKAWLSEQQTRMKDGDLYLVLQALEPHLNPENDIEPERVRACYRYMTNRLHQLDYLGALQSNLPIGSGEIESGHRHVVQRRMKRAGAWWRSENAESMLQLLTLRANNLWHGYWDSYHRDEIPDAA